MCELPTSQQQASRSGNFHGDVIEAFIGYLDSNQSPAANTCKASCLNPKYYHQNNQGRNITAARKDIVSPKISAEGEKNHRTSKQCHFVFNAAEGMLAKQALQ